MRRSQICKSTILFTLRGMVREVMIKLAKLLSNNSATLRMLGINSWFV